MIFFLNQNGTCTRQDTDHIYQGSNNASKVIAITSVAPIQSFVQVAFTLPNSLTYGYLPMAYKGAYQVGGDTDNQMYLYELDLPYNVTEVQGEVGVSFNVVNGVTGANMTSYTNTFTVEYSALPIPPASASESELEQILNLLNAYYAQNTGIITTHTSQIQAIQTEQTTQNNAISTLQAQSTSLQQAVTKNTSDIAEIKTEQAQQDEEIEKLKEASVIGETPVGTLPSSATLPTNEQIQQYYAQNVGRDPQKGDVFFFTQTLPSGYKVYKYIYGATGWAYYEIPGANVGSNPNLLINPNFMINQRGQTSYQNTGYTVDRWTLDANSSVAIMPKGIQLTGSIRQYYEYDERTWGQQITFSFKTDSGISSATGVLPASAPTSNQNIFEVPSNAQGVSGLVRFVAGRLAFIITATTSTTIYWAKVEIGSVATEFSPPSIAEELPKCQRYYQRFCQGDRGYGYPMISTGYALGATSIAFPIALACSMRNTPTVAYSEIYYRYGQNNNENNLITTINSPVDYAAKGASVAITVTGASGLTMGQLAFLQIREGGYIEFDAEI